MRKRLVDEFSVPCPSSLDHVSNHFGFADFQAHYSWKRALISPLTTVSWASPFWFWSTIVAKNWTILSLFKLTTSKLGGKILKILKEIPWEETVYFGLPGHPLLCVSSLVSNCLPHPPASPSLIKILEGTFEMLGRAFLNRLYLSAFTKTCRTCSFQCLLKGPYLSEINVLRKAPLRIQRLTSLYLFPLVTYNLTNATSPSPSLLHKTK